MKIAATIILSIFGCLRCYAQPCDQPAGLISAYYFHGIKHGSVFGIEVGVVDDAFPLGLILGCNYTLHKADEIEESPDNTHNDFANFYLKGIFRIARIDNRMSTFLVASPQLSFYSKFNFQSGIKIILPVSERLAFQFEPLYTLKQKTCLLNFHFSVLL